MENLEDYCRLLGVKPRDSQKTLKAAYLKLAKQYHPDVIHDDPQQQAEAAKYFQDINIAYEALKAHHWEAASDAQRSEVSQDSQVSSRQQSPESCYERAGDLAQQGDYPGAIEALNRAIHQNPNYAQAYQYRGYLKSLLGFEQQANSDLSKAAALGIPMASPSSSPGVTPPKPEPTPTLEEELRAVKQRGVQTLIRERPQPDRQSSQGATGSLGFGVRGLLVIGAGVGMIWLWSQRPQSLADGPQPLKSPAFNPYGRLEEKDFTASFGQIYQTRPQAQGCQAGVLTTTEQVKLVAKVNALRQQHGLKPVTAAPDRTGNIAKLSLLSAVQPVDLSQSSTDYLANSATPCWFSNAQDTYGQTVSYTVFTYNLGAGVSSIPASPSQKLYRSEAFIDMILTDKGKQTINARRKLLNPWLQRLSFGRADIKPLNPTGQLGDSPDEPTHAVQIQQVSHLTLGLEASNTAPEPVLTKRYVAYPEGPTPPEAFGKTRFQDGYPLMSFSAITDDRNLWNNKEVDYSRADVVISDPDQRRISVQGLTADNQGYGVPNSLQWEVVDLKAKVRYNVFVRNVLVNGHFQSYRYWFELT